jgi:PTS system ascorbate-specific IIA component
LAIQICASRIRLRAHVQDWRAAVRLAGELLVASGSVNAGYVLAMERLIDEAGPYCVVAPGLALPHAPPGPWVSTCSVSVLLLASPVKFGSCCNDPVDLVIPFAATSPTAHLETLAVLSRILSSPARLQAIRQATGEAEVAHALGGGMS